MRNNSSAFTLIEILLGLSLFSIISLSLYGTFSTGMQLNRRSGNTNMAYREIRWSLENMARDLRNMVAYDFANSYPERTAFSGGPEKISFFLAGENGLSGVSYYLREPELSSIHTVIVGDRSEKNISKVLRHEERVSMKALIREEKPFADTVNSNIKEDLKVDVLSFYISEGGLKFSYAYLEGEGENAKITWKNVWDEGYLPSIVRITITFFRLDLPEKPITIYKDVYIPTGYLSTEAS